MASKRSKSHKLNECGVLKVTNDIGYVKDVYALTLIAFDGFDQSCSMLVFSMFDVTPTENTFKLMVMWKCELFS